MLCERRQVRVELFGRMDRNCYYVDTMQAWILYMFDPWIPHRWDFDSNTQQFVIRILVDSTEHSAEIEVPALRWVFAQMRGFANLLPAHDSIGQAILLYRALQLLNLNHTASALRLRLMQEIHYKPLTAYDVQRIWWAFHRTNEWLEWRDQLLANLARFDLFNHRREGGYIYHFIEVEMLQLSEGERHEIHRIYQYYRGLEDAPIQGRVERARGAIGKGWGKLTCAPAGVVARHRRAFSID
jgi:hypothetical protein